MATCLVSCAKVRYLTLCVAQSYLQQLLFLFAQNLMTTVGGLFIKGLKSEILYILGFSLNLFLNKIYVRFSSILLDKYKNNL